MIRNLLRASTALVALTALIPITASAQQSVASAAPAASDEGVGEIIVTANRRAENLQQVPISVVAFQGEALKTQGIQSVVDLPQLTPGLGFTRTLVGTNAFLRGVGTTTAGYSTEVPIATYIDGLYLPNSAASSFSFNNIERIEVLKGPQGTLYGRNTTGGLINVITKSPGAVTSVDASASYGNFNTTQLNFYGSTPLSDTLAANFAALYIDQADGWGRNLFTGRKVYTLNDLGFQGKLLWKPDADSRVELRGFYDRTKSDEGDAVAEAPGEVGSDGSVFPGRYNINTRLTPFVIQRQYSVSLKAEHKFDFATLSSLTGFINNESVSLQTQSPVLGQVAPGQSTINLGAFQTARTLSEELQLTSRGSGPFQWIRRRVLLRRQDDAAGERLRHLHQRHLLAGIPPTRRPRRPASSTPSHIRVTPRARTRSGHRPASRSVSAIPTTRKSSPARLSRCLASRIPMRVPIRRHRLSSPHRRSRTTSTTASRPGEWSLRKIWQMTSTPMFPTTAASSRAVSTRPVSPTRPRVPKCSTTMKSASNRSCSTTSCGLTWRRSIIITAIFSCARRHPRHLRGGTILYNAASSRNYGLDADFVFVPVHNLTFSGGFELLDAHYHSFPAGIITTLRPISPAGTGGTVTTTGNLAGFAVPQAPNLSFSVGASYIIPSSIGEFELNANDGYRSSFAWESDNRLRQAAYHLVNASLTFRPTDSRFSLQAFAKKPDQRILSHECG